MLPLADEKKKENKRKLNFRIKTKIPLFYCLNKLLYIFLYSEPRLLPSQYNKLVLLLGLVYLVLFTFFLFPFYFFSFPRVKPWGGIVGFG